MTNHPSTQSLEERLEVVHETTSKINTLVHWLTLPEHVRSVLAEAWHVFSEADLAVRIGKDAAIISKWRQQSGLLTKVFELIKAHKNNPAARTLTSNRELIDAVMHLNEWASSLIIARAIGHAISEPTIRWLARIRSDMVEKRYFVMPSDEDKPADVEGSPQSVAAPTEQSAPKGIGETPEGKVRDYIRRHLGQSMGVNSTRRVMEQNGWVPPYARRSRINDSIRHFEAVRKNFLWHVDFKHHYINQCRVAILFFQDDYSRFLVGYSFSDSENIETVTQLLELVDWARHNACVFACLP